MEGQGAGSRTVTGDPAMVYEVPAQQFRDRYDLLVPATYTQITMDDQPVRGSMELLSGYAVYTLPIEAGSHRMRSDGTAGFGIKVYGIASYTSYTYPGGLDLQLLPPG